MIGALPRGWAQTLREFGRLDVLVNNAAFQIHTSQFDDLTEEHLDYTVKTNLYGYFYGRLASSICSLGAILNTGSVTGLWETKSHRLLDDEGGIHAFTRSLASNLVGRGIRVNAVARTGLDALNPSDMDPEKVAQFGARR